MMTYFALTAGRNAVLRSAATFTAFIRCSGYHCFMRTGVAGTFASGVYVDVHSVGKFGPVLPERDRSPVVRHFHCS